MVKLVGAVRNFRVNNKHVQIDVEDGTGLVRVILRRKEKECTAQRRLIRECNSNRYICAIGEVEDYYGVHEIIAFDVRPVSSGNEVTHHLLEVAYSFEKRLEYAEDEMLRAVSLVNFTCKLLNKCIVSNVYCLLLPVLNYSFFVCQTFHWPPSITISCHCDLFFMPASVDSGNVAPASFPINYINKGRRTQWEHKIFFARI
jgi:hypothetical protein